MVLGKEAYNKKDFKKAEDIFTSIVRYHPENAEAKEYAGLVYIAAGNYDKAINYFGALASMKGYKLIRVCF
jgi:tetratricopeptide (TPR) repeat protein